MFCNVSGLYIYMSLLSRLSLQLVELIYDCSSDKTTDSVVFPTFPYFIFIGKLSSGKSQARIVPQCFVIRYVLFSLRIMIPG